MGIPFLIIVIALQSSHGFLMLYGQYEIVRYVFELNFVFNRIVVAALAIV
jgi:hypothetical protein